MASRSPPVERSITVSAPHFSAHFSFSTSSSVPDETGDAPMLALILVLLARPIAIGSSLCLRWIDVGGNHHPPGGDFVAHLLRRQMRFALGDALHLRRDDAEPGGFQLRDRRESPWAP